MQFNNEVEIHKGAPEMKFSGVALTSEPQNNHLVLLSEKKFLLELIKSIGGKKFEGLGLVVCKKLFESLKEDELFSELNKISEYVLITDNFYKTLIYLSKYFHDFTFKNLNLLMDGRDDGSAVIEDGVQIGKNVFIGQNVKIGKGAVIGPYCSIGANSVIGENTVLFSHVTLYPHSIVGKNCRFHSQVSIGSDGFGYQFMDGKHQKIWHYGGVIIGEEVEIGANSCVDGGTFSPTIIGEGSKLDNHVQVGHNCILGKHVILCGQVGLGGSAKLADYVVFGGKSGCGPSIELGPGCQVGGGGLVNNSWPAGTKLGGHPARPVKEWMKGLAYVRKMTLMKNRES